MKKKSDGQLEQAKAKALEAKQKNAVPKSEALEPAPYAQGGYIPMSWEWSTVGYTKDTFYNPAGPFQSTPVVKEPQHGLHTIHAAYSLDKDVMEFGVETVDLETGMFTKYPVVMITASSIHDAAVPAEYIAKTLAHYLELHDLIPSFIKFLTKNVTNKLPDTNFWKGSIFSWEIAPSHSSSSPDSLSRKLPGINAVVKHPVDGTTSTLRSIIMNLNDYHKWSREKIADWLDEISDPTGVNGPDLRFKSKDDTLDEPEQLPAGLSSKEISIDFQLEDDKLEAMKLMMGMSDEEIVKFGETMIEELQGGNDEQD